MEVTGVVFRSVSCFSSSTADAANFQTTKQQFSRKPLADKFFDKGHLQYYNYNNGPRMAIKEKEAVSKKKKEMKKELKLLKGLSKEMGFGLNPDDGLDDQLKGHVISEAIGQLQKLRAEKMESKRRKKEEKARKKAARMMTCCEESSSSSSSSSESECDDKIQLKRGTETAVCMDECKKSGAAMLSENFQKEVGGEAAVVVVERGTESKKIEVCMGGKCKKSGAALLLENFQKEAGGEAAAMVVGCKCMGKCGDGPNVRLRDHVADPLCIGVGLEDVGAIVANFFGKNHESLACI